MVCPSGVKAIGSNIPGLVSTVPPAVKLPWVLRTIGLPSSALLGSFSSALTGMEKIDAAVAASTTLVRNVLCTGRWFEVNRVWLLHRLLAQLNSTGSVQESTRSRAGSPLRVTTHVTNCRHVCWSPCLVRE